MQDNHYIGEFYHLIKFAYPTTYVDSVFNEHQTKHEETTFLHAKRIEGQTAEREANTQSNIIATATVDWIVRYIPTIQPQPSWKVIDSKGQKYDVIAPAEPIGRNYLMRIRTRIAI